MRLKREHDRQHDEPGALRIQQRLSQRFEKLAAAEPDRADYQRDLSVSYNKMGDLYGALGQGEPARQAYAASLAAKSSCGCC